MYLAQLSYMTSSKNNLEESFCNYLRSIDRELIEEKLIVEYEQKILDKYDEFCKKFSRCKPLLKSFGNGYQDKGDRILYGTNATFTLLKSK